MLLQHDRAVPQHWADELARLTPANERVSWLVLLWEPGVSWRRNPYHTPQNGEPKLLAPVPIHRWVLYEATPPAFVPDWKVDMLLEEPVETASHRRMLRYYLETHALIEPWWIIQGRNGGHKVAFTETEKSALTLTGLSYDPPAPGALPYADFDQRVVRQITKWDRLRQGYASVQTAKRLGDRNAEQAFRRELVGWLGDQVQESIETEVSSIDDNTLPLNDAAPPIDFEALDERYIETGIL